MTEQATSERLTRMRAADRMRQLSDLFREAKEKGDRKALAKLAAERQRLKREFITVVK